MSGHRPPAPLREGGPARGRANAPHCPHEEHLLNTAHRHPCYARSMLHTPRLSLVPLGAEHFEPLAAMYADPEVIRFLEPAPLDRAEAWRRPRLPRGALGAARLRQLRVHREDLRRVRGEMRSLVPRGLAGAGDRLLVPPGVLGTWTRVRSRKRARYAYDVCRRPPSSAWCILTTSARSVWPNGAGRRSSGKWYCAGFRREFFSGRNTDPFPLSHQRNSARVRALAPCGRSYFSPP